MDDNTFLVIIKQRWLIANVGDENQLKHMTVRLTNDTRIDSSVSRWFKNAYLIILENVDQPADLHRYLPWNFQPPEPDHNLSMPVSNDLMVRHIATTLQSVSVIHMIQNNGTEAGYQGRNRKCIWEANGNQAPVVDALWKAKEIDGISVV